MQPLDMLDWTHNQEANMKRGRVWSGSAAVRKSLGLGEPRMSHVRVAAMTAQKLPGSKYVTADVSDESWREVDTSLGTYRIENPVTLVIRKGGSTHRVVDSSGVVHCYAAPETGKSIIRWKARGRKAPLTF